VRRAARRIAKALQKGLRANCLALRRGRSHEIGISLGRHDAVRAWLAWLSASRAT